MFADLQGKFLPDGTIELCIPTSHPRYVEMAQRLAASLANHAKERCAIALSAGKSSAPSGDPAKELAQFYADLWNAMQAQEKEIPDDEIATAADELSHGDWVLAYEDGRWTARKQDEEEGTNLSAQRSPKGGVTIQGRFYRGGLWIPSSEVAKADPQTQAQIQAGNTAHRQQQDAKRQSRGSVDVDALHAQLKPHADTHQLSGEHLRSAKLKFHALARTHGENTVHRIEELAGHVKSALDDTAEDDEGKREHLGRELAKLHHALGMAKERGDTGEVKELTGDKPEPIVPASPEKPKSASALQRTQAAEKPATTPVAPQPDNTSASRQKQRQKARSGLTTIPLQDIDFGNERLPEVTPLQDNSNKPIIVKQQGNKYVLQDGYGRANGLLNAGKDTVHAIVVQDGDLSQRNGAIDDPEWVAQMHHKYAPHSKMAISPDEQMREKERLKQQQAGGKQQQDSREREKTEERKQREITAIIPGDKLRGRDLGRRLREYGISLPFKDEEAIWFKDDPIATAKGQGLAAEYEAERNNFGDKPTQSSDISATTPLAEPNSKASAKSGNIAPSMSAPAPKPTSSPVAAQPATADPKLTSEQKVKAVAEHFNSLHEKALHQDFSYDELKASTEKLKAMSKADLVQVAEKLNMPKLPASAKRDEYVVQIGRKVSDRREDQENLGFRSSEEDDPGPNKVKIKLPNGYTMVYNRKPENFKVSAMPELGAGRSAPQRSAKPKPVDEPVLPKPAKKEPAKKEPTKKDAGPIPPHVEAAAASMQHLYDTALDDDYSHSRVKQTVEGMSKMNTKELAMVAGKLGFPNLPSKSTKADYLDEIERKVTERRENFENKQFRDVRGL